MYEVWADGWTEGEGKGGVKGLSSRAEGRVRVRGVYGFSSLVKQNKKGKNCAVFCFAGKRKLFFIYL